MENLYQNLWGNPQVHPRARIGAFVDIGKGVKIGKALIQCFVSIPPGIEIEDDVFIGPHVGFANHKHIEQRKDWKMEKTIVRKGASIGMGAMIGPGVEIGENAIIGMGAVVLKSVPAGETWVGVPAKKL